MTLTQEDRVAQIKAMHDKLKTNVMRTKTEWAIGRSKTKLAIETQKQAELLKLVGIDEEDAMDIAKADLKFNNSITDLMCHVILEEKRKKLLAELGV